MCFWQPSPHLRKWRRTRRPYLGSILPPARGAAWAGSSFPPTRRSTRRCCTPGQGGGRSATCLTSRRRLCTRYDTTTTTVVLIGLDWIGFDWIRFGWILLDSIGFYWVRLDSVRLCCYVMLYYYKCSHSISQDVANCTVRESETEKDRIKFILCTEL